MGFFIKACVWLTATGVIQLAAPQTIIVGNQTLGTKAENPVVVLLIDC